ncbi:hypothetical protein SPRG_06976 [Saprolegnia parasitica CBS 223.65]|uniref:Uncharacterized protein n=1 Tax=Saprolegnia parasitica (strain CBS 223.65) TaxID=695850 RepID=A0A067C9E1_SAPPC|nr:hypothetical protein SPRG_06976 [Saprolegnia parasitica CBS 223.65]KDO27389.1 hypothetical protein SPRG_06976 [Saprolegnia parasitica CBS 223.65]|eukprot:XP_012201829.1 hypothetical protein SPRG_06976 [Saprolegnia parasitica CBS 223.65]
MTSMLDVCSFAGCNQPPRFGSTKCVTHRNKLQCTFEGCKNQVYARYLCIRHGAAAMRPCTAGPFASVTAVSSSSATAPNRAAVVKRTPGTSVYGTVAGARAGKWLRRARTCEWLLPAPHNPT